MPKKQIHDLEDLTHAAYLFEQLKAQGQAVWAREFRTLLALAEKVVTTTYDEQDEAINDLEEFLR